jgi:uncharacterized membrane protein YeaQ/YmgE (transglycosylase-associated protein family)
MSILIWIVFGAFVGWIASMVMGSREGLLLDIFFGIVGSVVGTWIMGFFGQGGGGGYSFYSFLVALLGACVLIAIVGFIRRGSRQ